MKILITGGAGYIGSHTSIQAIKAGHEIIILDNLINSTQIAITRVSELTDTDITFINGDVRDYNLLDEVFSKNSIEAVIHFAGLKAVGESNQKPLDYYDTNVNGTLQLIKVMTKYRVKKLVFSSSATVYGEESPVPYIETQPRGTATSPYGASKAIVEQILEDLSKSDPEWAVALLRYFNPIGAHPSGRIGEDPKGTPNNLMPYISQVAVGRRTRLSIFGDNYPTKDGTCERDYLHVMDLADGHLCALEALNKTGCEIYNLGTGKPISVLEIVKGFETVNDVLIPFEFSTRREGDLPAFWADAEKAKNRLNWHAKRSLADMVRDTWNWQRRNPNGYDPL